MHWIIENKDYIVHTVVSSFYKVYAHYLLQELLFLIQVSISKCHLNLIIYVPCQEFTVNIQWFKLCRSSLLILICSLSSFKEFGVAFDRVYQGGTFPSTLQLLSLKVGHIRLKRQVTCRFLVHLFSISSQIGLQIPSTLHALCRRGHIPLLHLLWLLTHPFSNIPYHN